MSGTGVVFIVVISQIVGLSLGAMLIHYRYCYFQHSAELTLKREMVERGMSAQEIKLVIEAGKPIDSDDLAADADESLAPKVGKPRLSAHSELA